MTLDQKYDVLCKTPSDIHEHLPTLRRYASECDHVIEAGVRFVVSTFALLMGKPKRLVSIDIVHPKDVCGGANNSIKGHDEFGLAERFARENGIDFEFVLGDTLTMEMETTDMLFIDTLHRYAQLRTELLRHHTKVRKYIILHDTQSFALKDEGDEVPDPSKGQQQGLHRAITEFLEGVREWVVHEEYFNNNGLTVLKRKDDHHHRINV